MSLVTRLSSRGVRQLLSSSRAVFQVQHARGFANPAPNAEDDIVFSTFWDDHKKLMSFMDGLEKIPMPLSDTSKSSVKTWVDAVQKLKQDVGMPSDVARLDALFNYKLACAQGSARKFVKAALEDITEPNEMKGIKQEIFTATELSGDKLKQQAASLMSKYGIKDSLDAAALKEEMYDYYTSYFTNLKKDVEEKWAKEQESDPDLKDISISWDVLKFPKFVREE